MKDIVDLGQKKLVIVGLVLAILFVGISSYNYLNPYPYLSSSDGYRDYYTIENYLLQNKEISPDRLYSNRPLLYYFAVNVHHLTHITLFDLLRIVLPIIFSLSIAFFYLFYKELFEYKTMALTGALLTVVGQHFSSELLLTRPQAFVLVIYPLALWAYCKLYKQPQSWPNIVLFVVFSLALLYAHFFGTILGVILVSCILLRYLQVYKRYWPWIVIGILSSILVMLIFGSNTLVLATLNMFVTLYRQHDNYNLLQDTGLSLRDTLQYVGLFFSILVAGSGVILIIDRFCKTTRTLIPSLLILPSCLVFLFGLMMTWLGPVFGIAVVLPTRMLVYLWIGGIALLLYYLQRLPKPMMRFIMIGCLLITAGFIKQPTNVNDSAYVLGNEIGVVEYITDHQIRDSVIITQATTYPLFTLLPTDLSNITISNRLFGTLNTPLDPSLTQQNTKQTNKIFYADSGENAAVMIEKLIALRSIDPTRPIYIAYSLIKSQNTLAWTSLGFRKQSLDGANLNVFNDKQYFRLVFSNNDIKLWRYVPAH